MSPAASRSRQDAIWAAIVSSVSMPFPPRAHSTYVSRRLGGGKSPSPGRRIRPRLLERSPTPVPPSSKVPSRRSTKGRCTLKEAGPSSSIGFVCPFVRLFSPLLVEAMRDAATSPGQNMNGIDQFSSVCERSVPRRGPFLSADAAWRILGLPVGEADPVRIILAAHIRLRRWRRAGESEPSSGTVGHIRRINRARDALLQKSCGGVALLRSQVATAFE